MERNCRQATERLHTRSVRYNPRVKTAIISDLHLGASSGSDVLRDPEIRAVLFEELRRADRLVLLGDAIELRERPLGAEGNDWCRVS